MTTRTTREQIDRRREVDGAVAASWDTFAARIRGVVEARRAARAGEPLGPEALRAAVIDVAAAAEAIADTPALLGAVGRRAS